MFNSLFLDLVYKLTKVFFLESVPTSCKPILAFVTGMGDEYLSDHSIALGGEQNM